MTLSFSIWLPTFFIKRTIRKYPWLLGENRSLTETKTFLGGGIEATTTICLSPKARSRLLAETNARK